MKRSPKPKPAPLRQVVRVHLDGCTGLDVLLACGHWEAMGPDDRRADLKRVRCAACAKASR